MIFSGPAGGDFFAEMIPLIGEIFGIKSVPIESMLAGHTNN